MPSIDPSTSRRHFLKFLAASPFACPSLAAFASEAPSRLPDPMQWAPPRSRSPDRQPEGGD